MIKIEEVQGEQVSEGEFTIYILDMHRGLFIQSERCIGCFNPHFIQSEHPNLPVNKVQSGSTFDESERTIDS
jgi:hypothetical protein